MSKKIFLLALAALFLFGSVQVFGATPGYKQNPGDGEIVNMAYPWTPPKKFRLVRYGGTTSSLSADSIVIWDLTDDDGVTIGTTTTSSDSAIAGVIAVTCLSEDEGAAGNTAQEDYGKRNWTWLQTYGVAEVYVGAYPVGTAGAALGTGRTAGYAEAYGSSATSSRQNGYAGFFYDTASAREADVDVFLKCE